MLFSQLRSSDIAVDMGTYSTRIYVRGRGIVINESSAIALRDSDNRIVVVGNEAEEMVGRSDGGLKLRHPLQEGRVEDAEAMLGYRYSLCGAVVAGNRLGRTIGFPTANMQLYEPLKLIPGNGVYAVEAEVLGSKWQGMTNIGVRPTVGGSARTVETHLLAFDEDIYGLPLRITFLRKLRDEIRFPSLDALKEQLAKDRTARAWIAEK